MRIEAIKAIFAVFLVSLSTLGYGFCLLPFLPRLFSPYSRYVTSWIGGFGLLGLLLFVIGQWSFTRTTIGIVIGIGIAIAFIHLWQQRHSVQSEVRRMPSPPVIPFIVISLVLTITAIGGLAEPVGDWGADGVAYHLVGPKVWLRDGIVRPIPDNAPTSYPNLAEMTFAPMMMLGGRRAPGFSAAVTISFFLLLLGCLALRCGLDSPDAWWVAALFVTMAAAYEGAHSGFVDVIYASFILAAAHIGIEAETRREFAVFGAFCGFAMATKYPGLVAFPALLVCATWMKKGFSKRDILDRTCIAGIFTGIVASAIYLRNWILLGSPIYPPPAVAANFLHVKYYSTDALRAFYAYAVDRGRGHGRGLVQFLALPFNLTYHTADFHGAGGIGLAPLALGPFGVLAGRRDDFSRRLALLGALLLTLWFLTMQESRYLIHGYGIGAIFAVIGWNYTVRLLGKRGATLSAIVVFCSLSYGLYMVGVTRASDVHSVFSSSFAYTRRQTEIPYVESFDFLNRDPSVTRLLILDRSVPAYYSDHDYLKPFGQWGEKLFPDASSPDDILRRLGELKISHVLDVQSTISPFVVPRDDRSLKLVLDRPNQRIYRVLGVR